MESSRLIFPRINGPNIFPFFREFHVFSIENFKVIFKSWTVTKNATHDETRQESW